MPIHFNDSRAINELANVGAMFSHDLCDHPLLQMDEIRKLVKRLPEGRVFYSTGIKPETAIIGDGDTYPGQHPLDYAIDHMENANAYMYIIAPETDAVYLSLYRELQAFLDDFCRRNGYHLTEYKLALFITSPRGVAPHHLDHQHGFITQIRGTKTLYQWPAQDFAVTTPEQLEIFFARITRELALKEELEGLRTPYQLAPGTGAYIPFAAPHSVINGDEVSLSLSIIFNTTRTRKIENIYRANYVLRNRFGLSPSAPGESAWKDAVKNQYFITNDFSRKMATIPGRAARKLGRILKGHD